MTEAKKPKAKPKRSSERPDGKREDGAPTETTTAEFEQEGMGIAPKE